MKYKVGDKLMCKKNRLTHNKELIVGVGKVYKINKIVYDTIFFDDYYYFTIDGSNHTYVLYKYFYTMKEVRKMKLMELNDNSYGYEMDVYGI